MNKAVLIGRITKDPDIRYSQGAEPMCIARYTLAVDRRGTRKEGQQNADFISCIAFRKSAEFAEKYLRKGMKIAVAGHIQTGSHENKDGQRVYTTDVVVDEHYFCESRNNGQGNTQNTTNGDFMNIPDEIQEQLPFS